MTARFVRRSLAGLLVLLAVLLTPANIFSCGPFFEEPVFTRTSHPDQPLDLYAKGRLGIVLPGYERQYLVLAYRHLAGPPLSASDEKALIAAWAPKITPPNEPAPNDVPVVKWLDARSAALGQKQAAKIDIERFKSATGDYWQQYPNCGDDAFLVAAQTASTLTKEFGAGSDPVRDWVQAQDTVFQHCGDTSGTVVTPKSAKQPQPHLPAPPTTTTNAVLRMDRDYQIAAANFYAGSWPTAATQFQQIAEQRESPWRIWAPYLVARCLIREATLGAGEATFNRQPMNNAEQRLQAILKDASLAQIHPAAKRLLDYVEGRLHPDQRLHEVTQQLAGRAPAPDFPQDLIDFNWLLRQRLNMEGIDTAKWREDLAQRGLLDDLTDWVLTFSGTMPDSLAHSVERWRATKSQAWLMAALTEVPSKDSNASALADAAAAIAPTSPAYEMAVFHRARLLTERGDKDAARRLLDADLKRYEGGPLSSLNLLRGQRFALATDFHQFLEYAPRTPVELAWDMGEPESENSGQPQNVPLPKRFDTDSVGIINQRLPLTMLTQASTGDVLPQDLREALGTATLTRATILHDAQTAKALQSVAITAHPELREYLAAYNNAATNDARTFAATWTMLHFPGMKPFVNAGTLRTTKFPEIDNYRDNWWCEDLGVASGDAQAALSYSWREQWSPSKLPQKPTGPTSPPFLTETERSAAEREWRELSSIGAAPNYFGRTVLQWAKDHPSDDRLPEALHLVVRATRYGCSDAGTGPISKQAYDLLHARYPNSSWAKKTPYWFK
jgi:hypothetical protein